MAVPYYDLAKVKRDLVILDTGLDTELADWNDEAENEIDDMLYSVAVKARRITALPVLPYTAGSVPESVQGSADNYVKVRYYQFTKNDALAKMHDAAWKQKVENYINRLKVDKEFYGRIAR